MTTSTSPMMAELLDGVTLDHVLRLSKGYRNMLHFISIREDDSLFRCLEMMMEYDVDCIPLMMESPKSTLRCVGIVDCRDIMEFLLNELPTFDHQHKRKSWKDWSQEESEQFLKTVRIRQVMDLSRGDPLLLTEAKTPFESVLKFFASGLSHRCVVHLGDRYGVLSQIDVVSWFAKVCCGQEDDDELTRTLKSKAHIIEKLSETMKSVNLVHQLQESCAKHRILQVLLTASQKASVFRILQMMQNRQISGVAIVDDENTTDKTEEQDQMEENQLFFVAGNLLADFSIEDLKYIFIRNHEREKGTEFKPQALNSLNCSAIEFLEKSHCNGLNPKMIVIIDSLHLVDYRQEEEGEAIKSQYKVDGETYSLFDAVNWFAEHPDCRRMWLVTPSTDPAEQKLFPVGVASLTNILRVIREVF